MRHGSTFVMLPLTAMLLAIAPGCYASHLPPTDGERYRCTCEWDLCLPVDPCEDYDDDGRCTRYRTSPACLEDVPPAVLPYSPCAPVIFTTQDQIDGFCAEACREHARPPAFAFGAARTVDHGIYEGPGVCSTVGDPPREFVWPTIPADAVRIGQVEPEFSTVHVDLEGIGSADVVPDDTGTIAIQGGGCDRGTCRMSVRFFNVFLPPFFVGGHEVLDAHAGMAGSWMDVEGDGWRADYIAAAPPARPDTWRLLDPPLDLPLRFELTGVVRDLDPPEVGAGFSWRNGTDPERDRRDVLPGHPAAAPPFDDFTSQIDIRRGATPTQFIQLRGRAATEFTMSDGTHAAIVTFDVHYRFFDGSPHPLMLMIDSPSDSGAVVLDGRGTWDDLGGPAVRFDWLASRGVPPLAADPREPGAQVAFATGMLASVPRSVIVGLRAQGFDHICLRATDTHGLYQQTCGDAGKIGTWPPNLPAPGCADVAFSTPNTSQFAALVEASGWTQYLNEYPGPLTIIVPTNDMIAQLPPGYRQELTVNPAVRQNYVSQFIRPDQVITSDQIPGMHFVPGPRRVPIIPIMPDRGCGDGGLVQLVTR